MQNRENFLPFFIVLFTLSLVFVLLGRLGLLNFIFTLGKPFDEVRSHTLGVLSLRGLEDKEIKALKEENRELLKKLADQEDLKREVEALRAQFETSYPSSIDLLPAKVIAYPSFVPGVSSPEYLILNKGLGDGVGKDDLVVVGSNLVGKVIEVTPSSSKVQLISSPNSTFTAKIEGIDDSSGIVRGKGSGNMILDNVLLTLTLREDSRVLTKGEGLLQDLIIGKIQSIEKKSSDLFQRAEIRSSLDFSNLDIVFVIK